jgi:hypothetical protein
MWVDVGCVLVAASFCTVAAWVLVGAGAPSWAAALGAIAWWFVLGFAIRTVVTEVRAFYGVCVQWSGMDQRARLTKELQKAERELEVATKPSKIRAAAMKRRVALQWLAWLDEREAKLGRTRPPRDKS